MSTSSKQAKVAVIGTGGTFAMQARHAFDWVEYSESQIVLPIDTLIDQLGELAPEIELLPIPFRALGSVSITPNDWLELARLIESTAAAHPELDGFVITHGTATLEETAYFLDLALNIEMGVVITGAQRPSNTAGTDVPANLRAALAVAASPQAADCGALVVMDNKVYAARDVSKTSSFDLAAFDAVPFGPLAQVDANAVVHWRRLLPATAWHQEFDLARVNDLPRVDIVTSYAGCDGVAVKALVASGSQAIISAGLAPGRPASGEAQALAEAVQQGVIVVQSTRAIRGNVPVQDFLLRAGILAGGDLAPHKLRILMMLALTQSKEVPQLQRWLLNA